MLAIEKEAGAISPKEIRASAEDAATMRGFMVDSARCLESRDYYRRLIGFCAERGIDTILWHFTDDQGCSLRFDSMPEIASPNAYSKAEMRDLVRFAKSLGITLIPELETLGHSRYITGLPQYRHLLESEEDFTAICPLSSETREIMSRLLEEVAEVFDSHWIHVGLDEVNFGGHPLTQKALKTQSRQSIFAEYVGFIYGIVSSLGRRMIIWGDRETVELGLAPLLPKDVIIANWQYTAAVFPEQTQYFLDQGLDVILCPALITYDQQLLGGNQLGVSNIRSMTGHLGLNGRGRIRGLVTTVWTGTRYFHDAQWWGLHLAADIMRKGPETDVKASVRRFLRDFHGIQENSKPVQDAFVQLLDLAPLRMDYLPELSLDSLDEIDQAACMEKARKWISIRDALSASEKLIIRNKPAFETFFFTVQFLAYIYQRAAALKCPDSSKRPARVLDLLREGRAMHERMLEIWDHERFPDDPKKNEAALGFGESEYLIPIFRESLDRCSALLGDAFPSAPHQKAKPSQDLDNLPLQWEPDPVSSSAFTLIELLVVIAIIAILVALTLPALTSARQKAAQGKSLSNIRQISAAIELYTNDHSNYFPLGYFYQPPVQGVPYVGELSYVSELLPYVGGASAASIFISPTSSIQPVAAPPAGSYAMTYSVHNLLCPDTSNGAQPVRRTSVVRPSEVILIADGCQSPTTTYSRTTFEYPGGGTTGSSPMTFGMTNSLTAAIPVGPDADTTAGAAWFRYRNSGAVIVGMVDGHAQALQKGTVTYGNIIPDR